MGYADCLLASSQHNREKKISELKVDGRKAFLRISKKQYERVWTVLKWHRLGFFCRFL
jgi:hypothetical protein